MASHYHIPEFALRRPRTKIVCTIGPATSTQADIVRLIHAGMSVARLNLSHGDRAAHEGYIRAVRAASKETGVPVGILVDLPGPKYRTGDAPQQGILLEPGQPFVLTAETLMATRERATVWPAGLHRDVPAGASILIDEGAVELRVQRVAGGEIHCTVSVGGELRRRKAVTAPGHTSTLDYFTEETQAGIDFVKTADVDFVGLSYIRTVDDLYAVRRQLESGRKRPPQLVSKIELRQSVENLESILEASDGVMVARGDLGVEMPLAEVPGVQKRMITLANEVGKPVITATQMLESMIDSPHPTRAEVTDVHNAIRDGTDAIMLSGETSIGKYPVRAVEYMAQIACRAEQEMDFSELTRRRYAAIRKRGLAVDDAIAYSACQTADNLDARVILAFTESGSTAARVASFRPKSPILALQPETADPARLSIRWGVVPITAPKFGRVQEMFYEGSMAAEQTGYAKKGDLAVAVVGMPIGVPGNTNLLRVIRLPEPPPRPL